MFSTADRQKELPHDPPRFLLTMIRVLVVANSIAMRTGLEALITTDPTIAVVGSAASLDRFNQQVETTPLDVVLLDWSGQDDPVVLPAEMGLQAAIVLLVDELPDRTIAELLRAGVRGVITNEATAPEIVGAIVAVAAGLTVLHPDAIEALLPAIPATRTLPEASTQGLTSREVEVLGMLAEGLGNKTIARRLTISEHTVKFHISSIFNKLNASSRTEAVILGARQGLIFI